jgi:hypothetical protein
MTSFLYLRLRRFVNFITLFLVAVREQRPMFSNFSILWTKDVEPLLWDC